MTDVGAPAPEVYRLSTEKLPAAVGRARRFALVEVLASVTAVIALVQGVLRHSPSATDVSLVVWGLGVLLTPYVLWKAGLRVRRRWNAFELSIGPATMRCAARGAGRVTMALDAIASIGEGVTGLVVRSSTGSMIRIPRFVEGFIDVRARLERRGPITVRPDDRVWCAALAGSGALAAVTAPLWGGSGCIAAGVLGSQAAAAFAAAVDIRWHPRLPHARKLAGQAVLVLAAALPILGLVGREIALAALP
jgi:hypothetical protein